MAVKKLTPEVLNFVLDLYDVEGKTLATPFQGPGITIIILAE